MKNTGRFTTPTGPKIAFRIITAIFVFILVSCASNYHNVPIGRVNWLLAMTLISAFVMTASWSILWNSRSESRHKVILDHLLSGLFVGLVLSGLMYCTDQSKWIAVVAAIGGLWLANFASKEMKSVAQPEKA